jgi:organic hydroperoxide reductase OsmC/OhrA
MTSITVQLRSIPDTEAAVGWAGAHAVVVDRPDGKAGGKGLGFNGGELLGLAIGGCFCNDLQYVAHDLRVRLDSVQVEVTVVLEGSPLIATLVTMRVKVETKNPTVDVGGLIKRAREISTVANSVQRGISVELEKWPSALKRN